MEALRCEACGGAIAAAPGQPEPACLFCGGTVLTPVDPDTLPAQPTEFLPFSLDKASADQAFRGFAKSSFWYPKALRDAKLELRRLLVPAWVWTQGLTLYWTGLVSAATRSGKRPVSGVAHHPERTVLVPASPALSQAELSALGPFDPGAVQPWDPQTTPLPHELSELSRQEAGRRARAELARQVASEVTDQHGLLSGTQKVSAVPEGDGRGAPWLVPVWIGVYRYKDTPYRVVIHGRTGAVAGKAPIDWLKVVAVVLGVVALLGILFVVFSQL